MLGEHHEQPKWRDRALGNWCERRCSVRMNVELKKMYAQQLQLLNSMREALGKNGVLEGLKFVEQFQPTADRPFFLGDTSEPMLAELSSNLAQMHLRADQKMPILGNSPSVTLSTRTKHHGLCETRIETSSITPLVCSAQEAERILLHHITKSSVKQAFDFNEKQSSREEQTAHGRSCVTHLYIQNDKLDAPRYANAFGVYRKFEDRNRIDLVGQVRWFVPSDHLQLDEQYWTVIEPLPAEPERFCVVRAYCQLEGRSACTGVGSQQKETRDHVMEVIAKKSRQYLQFMQSTFLDQVDPIMQPSPVMPA
ncbi:hypothetical protein L914_00357 [Phytophthora nicotianae]|nr:hypothetical protein L914_00357 [Phytophthora nicotianae]